MPYDARFSPLRWRSLRRERNLFRFYGQETRTREKITGPRCDRQQQGKHTSASEIAGKTHRADRDASARASATRRRARARKAGFFQPGKIIRTRACKAGHFRSRSAPGGGLDLSSRAASPGRACKGKKRGCAKEAGSCPGAGRERRTHTGSGIGSSRYDHDFQRRDCPSRVFHFRRPPAAGHPWRRARRLGGGRAPVARRTVSQPVRNFVFLAGSRAGAGAASEERAGKGSSYGVAADGGWFEDSG